MYLRVPLGVYESTTHAFFPDETPTAIRRVYQPAASAGSERLHFCGFCGSPLSRWSERPRAEAEWLLVHVDTLDEDALGAWEDLLGGGDDADADGPAPDLDAAAVWTGLTTYRGVRALGTGGVVIEWDVVEVAVDGSGNSRGDGDDDPSAAAAVAAGTQGGSNGKWKLGDVEAGAEVDMG